MKIIIAPAKKMKIDSDSFEVRGAPVYLSQTEKILSVLKEMSYEELKKLWKSSDRLTKQNYDVLQNINLRRNLTPAVMAYTGIQYQYMAPDLMTTDQLKYLQKNLRILSGFYGILKPFDGIVPYRLEMQAKLQIEGQFNLYNFWNRRLYDDLYNNNHDVINLASKEYEKAIRPYLDEKDQLITCVFGEMIDGKVKQKATQAKMARGEMVNYISQIEMSEVNQLKGFNRLGYQYQERMSDTSTMVFTKESELIN